jgi:hypothetical protein
LPDDIVFKILKMAAQNVHGLRLRTSMPQRTTLPLVCKKWREILYLQGGTPSFVLHVWLCNPPLFPSVSRNQVQEGRSSL